jgi:hypothetical protein
MKTPLHGPSSDFAQPSLHGVLSDALHFWEPRRVAYNAALAVVVLTWAAIGWSRIHAGITFESLLAVLVLAVLANVCYCAAYLVEIPVQWSAYRGRWRQLRWLLWGFGTLFAVALTNYWVADEILPALIR